MSDKIDIGVVIACTEGTGGDYDFTNYYYP